MEDKKKTEKHKNSVRCYFSGIGEVREYLRTMDGIKENIMLLRGRKVDWRFSQISSFYRYSTVRAVNQSQTTAYPLFEITIHNSTESLNCSQESAAIHFCLQITTNLLSPDFTSAFFFIVMLRFDDALQSVDFSRYHYFSDCPLITLHSLTVIKPS